MYAVHGKLFNVFIFVVGSAHEACRFRSEENLMFSWLQVWVPGVRIQRSIRIWVRFDWVGSGRVEIPAVRGFHSNQFGFLTRHSGERHRICSLLNLRKVLTRVDYFWVFGRPNAPAKPFLGQNFAKIPNSRLDTTSFTEITSERHDLPSLSSQDGIPTAWTEIRICWLTLLNVYMTLLRTRTILLQIWSLSFAKDACSFTNSVFVFFYW